MVLTDTIIKFIEQGGPAAFLLEDLGLLKQKNEFPKVLQMIGYVYESVALNRGIGIIVMDPIVGLEGAGVFGKEGSMVEEKDRLDMKSVTAPEPQRPPIPECLNMTVRFGGLRMV